MVDQPPTLVHGIQVRTIAVVVRAQQVVQDAFLFEVNGAAHIAQVAARTVCDRVGDKHQQIARYRDIRLADQRTLLTQGLDSTWRIQAPPLDLQGLG